MDTFIHLFINPFGNHGLFHHSAKYNLPACGGKGAANLIGETLTNSKFGGPMQVEGCYRIVLLLRISPLTEEEYRELLIAKKGREENRNRAGEWGTR